MGNYSYLLDTINCENTNINWEEFNNAIANIKDDHYFYPEETPGNLEELAKILNGRKLFGYLTCGYIKILHKLSLFTSTTENLKKNPTWYFEEEGWNRIHYLEFNLGKEEVIHGSFAFDINETYFNNILEKEWEEKNLALTESDKEDWFIDKMCEKQKDYMMNLIADRGTNWNISKLDFNMHRITKEVDLWMYLMGIRPEDVIRKEQEDSYKQMLDVISSAK